MFLTLYGRKPKRDGKEPNVRSTKIKEVVDSHDRLRHIKKIRSHLLQDNYASVTGKLTCKLGSNIKQRRKIAGQFFAAIFEALLLRRVCKYLPLNFTCSLREAIELEISPNYSGEDKNVIF